MTQPIAVNCFIAVNGQFFSNHQEWVNNAQRRLTSHFTALCFDQKGRRCENGGDMKRADDDGSFPVWWVWPDQIAELIMGEQSK
jgi:hypothetical protein